MKSFREKFDEVFWRWGYRPDSYNARIGLPQPWREFWLEALGATVLLLALVTAIAIGVMIYAVLRDLIQ